MKNNINSTLQINLINNSLHLTESSKVVECTLYTCINKDKIHLSY